MEVAFNPHPLYRVEGADVYLELPVAPWEAALGARLKAPTPTGFVDLTIPPNSKQGSKLRLKGQGLPSKEPGHLYVSLKIVLPPADSEESKALYKEMQEKLAFDPRAKLGVS